jgi:hypothetical protein
MTHHDTSQPDHDHGHDHDHDHAAHGQDGTLSEGGSGSLNADTALGGADSVPDTPDVNDTGEADGIDTSEPGPEADAR